MSRKVPPDIEIYAMYTDADGSSTAEPHGFAERVPDFYDVIVRYDGDDPLEEIEDLKTIGQARQAANNLRTIYKGADIVECF